MAVQQHVADLAEYLLQFQQESHLCDVTLIAKNGQLKAHSVVLASVSDVLRRAICENSKSADRVILLPWLELHELEIAVRFIYTGCVVVPFKYAIPASLPRVISTLTDLGLKLPTVLKRYSHNFFLL
jgi:BTB/POZ domain